MASFTRSPAQETEKVGQQSKATRDYEKAKTLGYKSGQSKNAVSL